MVRIDTGPVEAEQHLEWVPKGKWTDLVRARRAFLAINLPHDCHSLLRFVTDAEQMWAPLGYASRDDLIAKGYELDPRDVTWALDGLKRWKPDQALPFERAIQLGKRGRPKKGEEKGGVSTLTDAEKNTRPHWMARLDRDRPDLAARVRAGDLSAHAAAIEAGFRSRTLTLPDDPRRALLKLIDRYGLDTVRSIVAALAEENGIPPRRTP